MANVLDLRRRIRSVKNTRQITKAMKMVSAAKLRRAQERAMAARPYAKMITSVLESLTRRIDIFDPETGSLRHPLFATRPEKRVLLIVISGDKGFAGAFNSNIFKTAFQFIDGNGDKEIDVEAVGRKARDLMRRHYPVAAYSEQTEADEVGNFAHSLKTRVRKGPVEVTGDHSNTYLVRGPQEKKNRIATEARGTLPWQTGTTVEGEFVEPVHLQIVCAQLWAKVGQTAQIQMSHLIAYADVDRALTGFYEDALEAGWPPE